MRTKELKNGSKKKLNRLVKTFILIHIQKFQLLHNLQGNRIRNKQLLPGDK